ncbi:sugar ABC transporter permease [Paraburkholderia dipogonis]|uniref:Sugar ABC transporter permease n=1 Tax=Paraburkholderia dipogonis TaxID=1211383 RepID=A0A4Y8MHE3_9BURK|nr:sugar ABC transporter permease [Paraburkholderia dipogonis]TFE36859.1 sugar ABC transporter permease [Paraburkholderia dipogonis]
MTRAVPPYPQPVVQATQDHPLKPLRELPTHWLMLAPALIVVSGLILYPAFNAIWLSLTDTNILDLADQKFVGLYNFQEAFKSDAFWLSLLHLLMWVAGCVSGQLVFGMIGALLLNQKVRGRAMIRGVVLVPWATASILVALMWLWMLNPNYGIINHYLKAVGLLSGAHDWLGDPDTAFPTLMMIDVWQGVAFFSVMILAALQSVPKELLEAAKIDGANAWHSFWRITLPFIMPTVLITVVLRVVWTANYFDLILVVTNGGPANSTMTLPLHAYATAYQDFDFGMAAALGIIQAVILAVPVVAYVRHVLKKEVA